jgi:hypothetical protein
LPAKGSPGRSSFPTRINTSQANGEWHSVHAPVSLARPWVDPLWQQK